MPHVYRRGHITLPKTEPNCSPIPALWFCDFLNQTEGRLKLRTERHSRVYQMGPHMFISTIIDLDLTTSPLPWSIPVASYLGPRFSSCYPTPHNQFFTQHPEEIFFDFFNRSITYIWRREHIGTASWSVTDIIYPHCQHLNWERKMPNTGTFPSCAPSRHIQPLPQGKPPFWLSIAQINFSWFWN